MKSLYAMPERLFPALPPPYHPIGDGGPLELVGRWGLMQTVSGLLVPLRISDPPSSPSPSAPPSPSTQSSVPLGPGGGNGGHETPERDTGLSMPAGAVPLSRPRYQGAERSPFPRRCPW